MSAMEQFKKGFIVFCMLGLCVIAYPPWEQEIKGNAFPLGHAFILTPISPHSFNQKPIVLPDHHKIEITVDSDYPAINLTIDGQQNVKVKNGDVIKIKKNGTVEFLRLPTEHYFKNLRNKLGWGERVEKCY